jgi:hypothetical protein
MTWLSAFLVARRYRRRNGKRRRKGVHRLQGFWDYTDKKQRESREKSQKQQKQKQKK